MRFYSLTQSRAFSRTIFYIPIVAIFLVIVIKILYGNDDELFEIAREDSPVEYATAIVFFISFIFSLAIAKFFKKRKILGLFFILAGLFLFIALEEISWGQRIFNIETPDLFSKNYQGEINIHNLGFLTYYFVVGYIAMHLLGSFTWFVLPEIRNIFFKKAGNNYKTFMRYLVPSKYLFSYFFPLIPYLIIDRFTENYFLEVVVGWNFLDWYDYELLELLLGIGILLFVVNSYVKVRADL